MKKTLYGGERIGAGGKMQFDTKTFNRSTHNLSETFRSTMSTGTLVPFLVLPTLPGDTIDIDLDVDVRTLPTVGPLFGSYKVQLDVYQIPLRLYMRDLQMNKLEIGRDMSKVKFPLMELKANDISLGLNYEYSKEQPWGGKEIGNCQIEPSTILSYLGMKGLGQSPEGNKAEWVFRQFNAIPWLMYWDIFKQYYANKMEDKAYYIHNDMRKQEELVKVITLISNNTSKTIPFATNTQMKIGSQFHMIFEFLNYEDYNAFLENEIIVKITHDPPSELAKDRTLTAKDFNIQRNEGQQKIYFEWKFDFLDAPAPEMTVNVDTQIAYDYARPNLKTFDLKNIDVMRNIIMVQNGDAPLVLNADGNEETLEPYASIFKGVKKDGGLFWEIQALQCKQEGLAIKTYQSDVNNNWLNTEWIDGANGVNAVTAIQIGEDGKFTLDEFNIKKKVYDMLNHIVASGGSYDDWQDTIWGVNRIRQIASPVYEGGLSKELIFQEVISNSASDVNGEQALGTLAGRGVVGNGKKGGKLVIKTTEPSYIIGIASLTPRIDYSTGNEWHTNLLNMGELHNPYLDAIGYQDLITDTLAFWDTIAKTGGTQIYKKAGKQPSWINYQTSKNKVFGNFALENEQMFMVLNRRYEVERNREGFAIGDVTTFIDPSKYQHIFADASPDAQNFWVQIACGIEARRVMSANQIPNL